MCLPVAGGLAEVWHGSSADDRSIYVRQRLPRYGEAPELDRRRYLVPDSRHLANTTAPQIHGA